MNHAGFSSRSPDMALTVNSALITAQAQTQAPRKSARSFTPPPVEKLAARAGEAAVRVELSPKAAAAGREAAQARQAARAGDETHPGPAREFAREAPLKSAQKNAGTRPARPGSRVDIRI